MTVAHCLTRSTSMADNLGLQNHETKKFDDLQENGNDSSSVESSPYDVLKIEAHLYFAGLRGAGRPGPKLIFRTSSDVYALPEGPEAYSRLMHLRPVYEHDKLGEDGLWELVRSKCVELLDLRNIRHSSVDLVRFSWLKENNNWNDEDNEDNADNEDNRDNEDNEDYEDYKDYKDDGKTVYTTPVTIWVGVLPDTLTSEIAFHSSQDILELLRKHGITDVDVAYRESVSRLSSGPELFEPVSDYDPLKAVVDPLTTALGLPIAGLKTLEAHGTMGFYFHVGEEWYAVTARHVLFPEDEGNYEYVYKAGQARKDVVLMGTGMYTKFVRGIAAHIANLDDAVEMLEPQVITLTARLQGGGPDAQQVAGELEEAQRELTKTRTAVDKVKEFSAKVAREWKKPADRVIGHVVWAPPISVAIAPHSYTQDVCVVKLDKNKFIQNFKGNVLDLGPEIGFIKFIGLMYPQVGTASDFEYPDERLLKLQAILSKEDMRTPPTNKNRKGDLMRYVIKRGTTTLTTVGCLNGFESHCRRYIGNATLDSVEVAIFPYGGDSTPFAGAGDTGPFSEPGDSGSVIVDANGKFVALLTGGMGLADCPDITFGTPIHWLWDVIQARFEGASLDFDE